MMMFYASLLYLDKYEDLYKNVSLKLKDITKEYNTNEGKISMYKNINTNQLNLIEKWKRVILLLN